jgi:hypothetical protein
MMASKVLGRRLVSRPRILARSKWKKTVGVCGDQSRGWEEGRRAWGNVAKHIWVA